MCVCVPVYLPVLCPGIVNACLPCVCVFDDRAAWLCGSAQGKDDEIVVLEEEVKRLRAGLMTDDVRDRLEFLEGENTRLRDELGRLKTAFMEMTQVQGEGRRVCVCGKGDLPTVICVWQNMRVPCC